jgi:hypothetical protein
MRVLLSDGSGLTARQVATELAVAGHQVGVLSPSRFVLTRFTRTVEAVHHVPPYGEDPWRWLDSALRVAQRHGYRVLFPTQEQVAVLARATERLVQAGVATAVPTFDALRQVQDKASASVTLRQAGLPTPVTMVITEQDKLRAHKELPVFLKAPIGTASTAVYRVTNPTALQFATDRLAALGAFDDGGVVVQAPVDGPLVMIQSVFDRGRLVACHSNLRVREGSGGGASSKQSINLPVVRDHLERLGDFLGWNGALSLDAILEINHPRYIDINPRLVEPANARHSGVDLVGAMLSLCRGEHPVTQRLGRSGVRTHQLLMAVLGSAEHGEGRRGVIRELTQAIRQSGAYRASAEELTPLRGDLPSVLPIAAAAAATLIQPGLYRKFTTGAVGNYALTPPAWRRIVAGS